MKRLLIATIILACSTALSAQTLPSVKKSDVKKEGAEMVSKTSSDTESQISEALMKDEDLQNETIDYLKGNDGTKDMMMGMLKGNKGGSKELMKSILSDDKLSSAAIDWIAGDSKMMKKVQAILGK